jgi:Replication-relaxation
MDASVKIKRRSRFRPQSTGRSVTANARDIIWLQKLWQHGPLPMTYLHQFTKDRTPSLGYAKHRLGDLYHEDNTPHGGRYIVRPEQQYESLSEYSVYDLNAPGEQLLKQKDFISHTSVPSKKTNFHHRLMAACITSSIDLACRDAGLTFVHAQKLLNGRSLEVPLTISHNGHLYDKALIPDAYFAINYGDNRARMFLLEADRNKEPGWASGIDRTSYLRKILQYRKLIETGAYKEHFGIKGGMLVLNVTVNYTHMEHLIDLVMKLTDGRGCNYMLFKVCPQFADKLTVPPVLSELLTTPWRRAGHSDLDISKA